MIIEIGNLKVRIDAQSKEMERMSKDFLVDSDSYDFDIHLSQQEIERRYQQYPNFSYGYSEVAEALEETALAVLDQDYLFLHSAVIEYRGQAYAFSARSGTGKTTHTNLWKKYLGEAVKDINGDKPFYIVKEDGISVTSGPWAGKEGYKRKIIVPLKSLCFLQQGKKNSIRRLTASEVSDLLFYQVVIPEEENKAEKFLLLIDRFVRLTPCYLLTCDISEEAVKTSFEAMTGESYPWRGNEEHEN